MSEHKITAEIEILSPDEAFYPTIEIEYNFTKGSPGIMWGDHACPPDPAEVEATNSKLIDGNGLTPTPEQVWQWAQDYLESERGYQLACEHAVDAYGYW